VHVSSTDCKYGRGKCGNVLEASGGEAHMGTQVGAGLHLSVGPQPHLSSATHNELQTVAVSMRELS
jgi:hypothetical protein